MSDNKENQRKRKSKRYIIGIVTFLLLFCVSGCGTSDKSEKEQADEAFQEAFNQSYLLPDELGKDKTVVELLDVLCGNESVFYLKRDDGMIDVTYQAKTVWMDKDTDVKFSLEFDPENHVVMPIRMTLDGTEMEPRFMDAFLLQCAGYDTLAQEVLDQWANGQSESYFEEMKNSAAEDKESIKEIDEKILETLENLYNSEASAEITQGSDEAESNSEKSLSEYTAVEFYSSLEEDESIDFVLSDQAKEFLSEHNEWFPWKNEDGFNFDTDMVDWEITTNHLYKNPERYGNTLIGAYLQVLDVREIERGTNEYFTNILCIDELGNAIFCVYKGELPEVLSGKTMEIIGLPLGLASHDNGNGEVSSVIVIAPCDVNVYDEYTG